MLGDKQKRFRIRFARDTEPIFFRDVEEMQCEGRRGREFRRMRGLAGAVQSVSSGRREAPAGRTGWAGKAHFPGRARGNALPAGDFLSDARHFAETGDAVVDVGVGAEQLGHAAAEEGGDDEHFRRGGVAVLHGDALVP